MISTYQCILCKSPFLISVLYLKKSVTSECRSYELGLEVYRCSVCGLLQKLPVNEYRENVKNIYNRYKLHSIVENTDDQIKFVDGKVINRTNRVLKSVQEFLPVCGKALDFGTGNGAMVSALFGQGGWSIDAYDVCDDKKEKLISSGKIGNFYTCLDDVPDKRYDLVTMVHVLEHLLDPIELLVRIKVKMSKGGFLIVQVPDVNTNSFDLTVYDHVMHFTHVTLLSLVRQVFNQVMIINPTPLDGEITALCVNGSCHEDMNTLTGAIVDTNLPEVELRRFLENIPNIPVKIAIFGTAIAGTYLGGILSERIIYFLDEDPSKIGMTMNKIQIIHPAELANKVNLSDVLVILPFEGHREKLLRSKYPNLCFYSFENPCHECSGA